ncbi:hypothetical protein SLEP1_g41313 [Rubroshorea leprosula]|uniref:Uncharacterized protein n=1 Tax=Rubroshorea leprosula TaxID=152421 RepID=A0AAV5L7G0_9ROSI|nr:hypothetical protein SLEP1_g41313 [Rubroshorea leprosula]
MPNVTLRTISSLNFIIANAATTTAGAFYLSHTSSLPASTVNLYASYHLHRILLIFSRHLKRSMKNTGWRILGMPLNPNARKDREEDLDWSGKKGPGYEFLAENDKNEYDWFKTPPVTPLFPSLEMEANAPQLIVHHDLPILQALARFAGNSELPKGIIGAPKSSNQKTKVLSRSITPSYRAIMTDRSTSATRSRPATKPVVGASQKPEPIAAKPRRQSFSPSVTRGRRVEPNNQENKGNGTQILGSKMVEKVMNARKSGVEERERKQKITRIHQSKQWIREDDC